MTQPNTSDIESLKRANLKLEAQVQFLQKSLAELGYSNACACNQHSHFGKKIKCHFCEKNFIADCPSITKQVYYRSDAVRSAIEKNKTSVFKPNASNTKEFYICSDCFQIIQLRHPLRKFQCDCYDLNKLTDLQAEEICEKCNPALFARFPRDRHRQILELRNKMEYFLVEWWSKERYSKARTSFINEIKEKGKKELLRERQENPSPTYTPSSPTYAPIDVKRNNDSFASNEYGKWDWNDRPSKILINDHAVTPDLFGGGCPGCNNENPDYASGHCGECGYDFNTGTKNPQPAFPEKPSLAAKKVKFEDEEKKE